MQITIKKPVVFMGLPLILIMIVVTFVPIAYAAGDIDGNGTVDLKDAVLSLQICAGSASTGVHSDEDINNDQKIGMEEAVYILTAVSRGNITRSITQFGITWTFDKDYQYGRYANGDYWVLGPITITDINPPSIDDNGRIMNGSMLNPMPHQTDIRAICNQGFDNSSLYSPYDHALNIGFDIVSGGDNLTIPSGSLVSSISRADPGVRPQLESASVLTIVTSLPAEGSFRPPYCGTDKTSYFKKDDLDYTKLKQYTPTSLVPVVIQATADEDQNASVERMFERPWIDFQKEIAGDHIHPQKNMPHYGAEIATQIGMGALILNCDYTNAQKEKLLIRYTQLGIDLYGIMQNKGQWIPNGGIAQGRKWPILFAGLVLNDTAGMAAIGSAPDGNTPGGTFFHEDGQTFYVSEDDIYSMPYPLNTVGTASSNGTVTVTKGSATVTGIGTSWTTDPYVIYFGVVDDAEAYKVDGKAYEVNQVISDTELILEEGYRGNDSDPVGTIYADQPYKVAVFVYYGHGLRQSAASCVDYKEFTQDDLGKVMWGIEHPTEPEHDSDYWPAEYRRQCNANAWPGFVLAAWMMGAKTLWNHDAIFDYMDHHMAVEGVIRDLWIPGEILIYPMSGYYGSERYGGQPIDFYYNSTRANNPWSGQMWDTYRDLFED